MTAVSQSRHSLNSGDQAPKALESEAEQTLMEKVASNQDKTAFEELVRRFSGPAYSLASRITGQSALAEEAVQDGLMYAWRYANTWRPEGSVRGWILKIVVNSALGILHSHRRAGQLKASSAVWNPTETNEPDNVPPEMERREAMAALRLSIDGLSPQNQQIVAMYYGAEMSQQEIGKKFGLTQRGISKRIEESISTLRTALNKAGVTALEMGLTHALLSTPVPRRFSEAVQAKLWKPVGIQSSNSSNPEPSTRVSIIAISMLMIMGAGLLIVNRHPTNQPEPHMGIQTSPDLEKKNAEANTNTENITVRNYNAYKEMALLPFPWMHDFNIQKPGPEFKFVGNWYWRKSRFFDKKYFHTQLGALMLPGRIAESPVRVKIYGKALNGTRLRENPSSFNAIVEFDEPYTTGTKWTRDKLTTPYNTHYKFEFFIFENRIVRLLNGKLDLVTEFNQAWPGGRLWIVATNFMILKLQVDTLNLNNLPNDIRNPEQFKRQFAHRKHAVESTITHE